MTRLERVTTESTIFNTSEFTKAKIDHTSQSLITKFKTLSGSAMEKTLLLSLVNSLQLLLCMMLMDNPLLSLERDSEILLRFVLSITSCLSEDLATLPRERWTSGASKPKRN